MPVLRDAVCRIGHRQTSELIIMPASTVADFLAAQRGADP
jgi:hypothetical protein